MVCKTLWMFVLITFWTEPYAMSAVPRFSSPAGLWISYASRSWEFCCFYLLRSFFQISFFYKSNIHLMPNWNSHCNNNNACLPILSVLMTQETSNRENIILNNFNVISVYKGNVNFIQQRRPSCLYAIKLHVLTSVLVLCVVNKQK